MAGTTRLELATSAVTETLIVPALFPDSSVGNSEPDRGRIGTDVLRERTQGSTDRKQYLAESKRLRRKAEER
jgi:hypothetical protein